MECHSEQLAPHLGIQDIRYYVLSRAKEKELTELAKEMDNSWLSGLLYPERQTLLLF